MRPTLLDKECEAKFAKVMATELLHAQMYHQLANSMQAIGYFGAQKKFLAEVPEETGHYQKHVDFVNDLGAIIDIPAVPTLQYQPETLAGALKIAYDAEVKFLNDYKNFVTTEAGKPEIVEHLWFYINVQRTTVGEYMDLLARVDLVKDNPAALLLIDQELGQ